MTPQPPANLQSLETHLTGDTPAIVTASGDDMRRLIRYVRALEECCAELRIIGEEKDAQLVELRAVLAGRKK